MSMPGRGNIRGRALVRECAWLRGRAGLGAKLIKEDAVEEPGLQGLVGPGEDSARF